MQIYCALRNLCTFFGVNSSELLPHSVNSSCNIIINSREFISRFAITKTTDNDRQIKHLFSSEFVTMFTVRDEPLFVLVMYLFVA